MKKIIALVVALTVSSVVMAAETKRVCTDVVEKGKTVQKCKNVKVHKKHEGTKVPEKAPAKKSNAKPEPKK